MELKYGLALYFLDEVEYKEEYKEGDIIKVYQLIKRDNKPWLDKNELEYKEEGGFLLKGGVFRKEFQDGWLQFDLKEWKLKIIWYKNSFKLNEPMCYPEKEKEKVEIKYEEEYVIEGERYKLKERGGPIKGPIFEKISSSNSPTQQNSEKDMNDLKNKNAQQEKIINDLKTKNDEQEKAINDLKSINEEQGKTLEKQGKQIEQLQEQLAQEMQLIQKGMLPK
ncbi:hypothetical protein M9Y10_006110 [Tritrichomonas musculus]|uniref:Uncharacterized protein n=1 Tax=Tritrichomonas musculus TaxID=1915356 RepID=A0ABR2JFL2_9EUKA